MVVFVEPHRKLPVYRRSGFPYPYRKNVYSVSDAADTAAQNECSQLFIPMA